MKSEAVCETITKCIKNLFAGRIKTINSTDRLEEDLNIDSMSATELVFCLEEEFGVEISDNEMFEMKTVQNIVDLIIQKTEQIISDRCA